MPSFAPHVLLLAACALPVLGATAPLSIEAVNPLDLARPNQTLELSAADLAPLSAADLNRIHLKDATGRELLCQAIDQDGDPLHTPDAVIFQADFAAGETKTFQASSGAKQVFTREQYRAFGRFVRERFDDFAWENDRIAHRTYGKGLETWQGEPLCSSTIDIWSKRVPRMVVNDWYLGDDYHADHGEGADFYSAGLSRGCGGSGLWAAERLWVSRNFVNSRVLANGPLRVMFELDYEPYDVNGVSVAEVKRVTLDAGQHFNCFQSRYQPFTKPGQAVTLVTAIGLKKTAGETVVADPTSGWLAKWEPIEKKAGQQGLAIITRKDGFSGRVEDKLNYLVLTQPAVGHTVTWWAGCCWDKAGQFASADAWQRHVADYARGLAAPIQLTVVAAKSL